MLKTGITPIADIFFISNNIVHSSSIFMPKVMVSSYYSQSIYISRDINRSIYTAVQSQKAVSAYFTIYYLLALQGYRVYHTSRFHFPPCAAHTTAYNTPTALTAKKKVCSV